MSTIYNVHNLQQAQPFFFFFGGGGGDVNINFIQAVLTCIHRYRLEAV